MLERIKTYLMLRMTRQKKVKWNHKVGPKVFKIIKKNIQDSGTCIAQNAGGGRFHVTHMHGGQYAVNLTRHTCLCRKWDLCGIPC